MIKYRNTVTQVAFLLGLLLLQASGNLYSHPGGDHKIEMLTHMLESQPNSQPLYIKRGSAYTHEQQYELALKDFQRAQQLGDPVEVDFNLGVLYYETKAFDKAVNHLDGYLAHFPKFTPALEFRAKAHRENGDRSSALRDFTTLLEENPYPNLGQYLSVAKMVLDMDGEGVEVALSLLDQGLNRFGVVPQLQQYAVELEVSHGNFSRAITRHETLKAVLHHSPKWDIKMVELQCKVGNISESKKYQAKARKKLSTLKKTPYRIKLLEQLASFESCKAIQPDNGLPELNSP